MRSSHASGLSGSSRSDVAFSFPPPQSGRTSSSSVRATQRKKIGALRERSATCSTRSTKTGSAHWRSSITTTCGRSAARALEQPAKRNARLLGHGRDDALGVDAERNEHLDERPVGDALPVREAAAAKDVGSLPDTLEEVGDEARLADAGRTEEREELTGAIGDRILEGAPETLPFPLAAHERRGEVACDRQRVTDDVDEPICVDRRGLSLQLQRRERLDDDRIADEKSRLGPDENLAVGGALLEPRGDVDRVAGDERLSLSAHDDLARVDPDPCLQLVLGDRLAHLPAPRARREARRPRAPSGSRRRPSPHRRRTSPPCRRDARGSRADPRSSGACARAPPRDPPTRREPSSRRGRRTAP